MQYEGSFVIYVSSVQSPESMRHDNRRSANEKAADNGSLSDLVNKHFS